MEVPSTKGLFSCSEMEGRGEQHSCGCRLVKVKIPDENDPMFVSEVSKLVVATIQDAKQTISQFEYLFCRLLYPTLLRTTTTTSTLQIQTSDDDNDDDDWKYHLHQLELHIRQVCFQREQARQDCHALNRQLLDKDQQLTALERDNNLCFSQIKDLQCQVAELQNKLLINNNNNEDLTRQFLLERQRRQDLSAAYKKLKSENNFLRLKCGATNPNVEGDSGSLSHGSIKIVIPPAMAEAGRNPVTFPVADQLNKVKTEIDSMENSEDENDMKTSSSCDNMVSGELSNVKEDFDSMGFPKDEEGDRSNQVTISRTPNAPALTRRVNLGASAGSKRPASGWRDTRCRQSPGGADPHDDFLDTPYENIRENLHRVMNDNLHNIAAQVSKDMTSCSSDDDTQDMKAQIVSKTQQQVEAPRPAAKGFKFVEPVRKKSERQGLSGFDCNQCKKFYDVVLSDAAGNGGEVEKRSMRCEHHEGVSRHRYRYVPPMTPEGFWNIGFDSDI